MEDFQSPALLTMYCIVQHIHFTGLCHFSEIVETLKLVVMKVRNKNQFGLS